MAVLKCKMCGGELIVESDTNICECEYCGSKQTVPNLDDEKKVNLFTRANRLRLLCEFDKAFGVYESIIAEFPEEAEAYWGLILCKYGIEYVDDPKDGKKIPTCHRTSFESVMQDSDFEMVMEYSDGASRSIYREEAKKIEMIRAGIVEVSSKEEPYDIFICYKETAEDGQRTIDSVIAQDVYNALIEQGYKVFFSRITLEDKLGQEYEPYIFAALNSAKVMLVFGTDYEYFNAVWVKNEWKRFLSLIEKGEKKTLIPCYKDIDAYDMPKEFARLQAQDMGKVGAIQDLLRGVNKILEPTTQKNESGMIKLTEQGVFNGDALLKRGFMALEDNDWESASKFFDQVLNLDAENGQAYLGLTMCEWKISTIEKLEQEIIFINEENNKNFGRAMEYLKGEMQIKFSTILEDKKRKEDEVISILKAKRNENKKAEGIIISPWIYLKTDGTIVAKSTEYKHWKNIKQVCNFFSDTVSVTVEGDMVSANTYSSRSIKPFQVGHLKNIENIVFFSRDILAVRDKDNHLNVICKKSQNEYMESQKKLLQTINTVPEIKKISYIYDNEINHVILDLNKELKFFSQQYGGVIKKISDVEEYVVARDREIFCLKSNGTVSKIDGQNMYEEENYKNWKNVIKIETNNCYSRGCCIFALKNNGTVMFSGSVEADVDKDGLDEKYQQVYFEVNNWNHITDISYNGTDCIMGLKADGTVVASGNISDSRLKEISSWKNIVAIKSEYCMLALTRDGDVLFPENETELNFLNGQKMFENFDSIEEERKNIIFEKYYLDAVGYMDVQCYSKAIAIFKKIENYKDSLSRIEECEKKSYELEKKRAEQLAKELEQQRLRKEKDLEEKRIKKEEEQKKLLEKINYIEAEISVLVSEIDKNINIKNEKESRLNSLGIFAMKEKKILSQEIEQLERNLNDLKSKKSSTEIVLENCHKKLKALK